MSKLFSGAMKDSIAFGMLKYKCLTTPELLTRKSQSGNITCLLYWASVLQSRCLPGGGAHISGKKGAGHTTLILPCKAAFKCGKEALASNFMK